MNCSSCGAQIPEGTTTCPRCNPYISDIEAIPYQPAAPVPFDSALPQKPSTERYSPLFTTHRVPGNNSSNAVVATATPIASPNPYPPYSGTLLIDDPLRDNSLGLAQGYHCDNDDDKAPLTRVTVTSWIIATM